MPDRGDLGFFTWLATEPGKAALAGALGGIVRWITLRDNWKEGSAAVIVGGICALYLGPVAEPLVEAVFGFIAPDQDAKHLAPFIVGIGGIGLASVIIDVVHAWRRPQGDREGGDDERS